MDSRIIMDGGIGKTEGLPHLDAPAFSDEKPFGRWGQIIELHLHRGERQPFFHLAVAGPERRRVDQGCIDTAMNHPEGLQMLFMNGDF
jgi:hypothetical protein